MSSFAMTRLLGRWANVSRDTVLGTSGGEVLQEVYTTIPHSAIHTMNLQQVSVHQRIGTEHTPYAVGMHHPCACGKL